MAAFTSSSGDPNSPYLTDLCCLPDYFLAGLGDEISSTVQLSVRNVQHKELNNTK